MAPGVMMSEMTGPSGRFRFGDVIEEIEVVESGDFDDKLG